MNRSLCPDKIEFPKNTNRCLHEQLRSGKHHLRRGDRPDGTRLPPSLPFPANVPAGPKPGRMPPGPAHRLAGNRTPPGVPARPRRDAATPPPPNSAGRSPGTKYRACHHRHASRRGHCPGVIHTGQAIAWPNTGRPIGWPERRRRRTVPTIVGTRYSASYCWHHTVLAIASTTTAGCNSSRRPCCPARPLAGWTSAATDRWRPVGTVWELCVSHGRRRRMGDFGAFKNMRSAGRAWEFRLPAGAFQPESPTANLPLPKHEDDLKIFFKELKRVLMVQA